MSYHYLHPSTVVLGPFVAIVLPFGAVCCHLIMVLVVGCRDFMFVVILCIFIHIMHPFPVILHLSTVVLCLVVLILHPFRASSCFYIRFSVTLFLHLLFAVIFMSLYM